MKSFFLSILSKIGIFQEAWTIYQLVQSYPGLDRKDTLREWISDWLTTLAKLATRTKNELDDRTILKAREILLDEEAFAFLYRLIVSLQYKNLEKALAGDSAENKAAAVPCQPDDLLNPRYWRAVDIILSSVDSIRRKKEGKK